MFYIFISPVLLAAVVGALIVGFFLAQLISVIGGIGFTLCYLNSLIDDGPKRERREYLTGAIICWAVFLVVFKVWDYL